MRFQVDFISLKGSFSSRFLGRNVKFRLVAPPNYRNSETSFPVLLMNDGQDFRAMHLESTLVDAYKKNSIHPFIYIGLETNENRMYEYGTASSADYKRRGNKAMEYTKFIIDEFIPFLKEEFKVSHTSTDWVFCGMSLGGLSAFDIVFNHAHLFGKVGVFSGSFWWRKKAYVKKDLADRSRIVLNMVRDGDYSPHLKFWFQCGTEDEQADRNNNGIIDSIDDTQDLIKELKLKGYKYPEDITYTEIEGGRHDLPTWADVFPEFLQWAFKKRSYQTKAQP